MDTGLGLAATLPAPREPIALRAWRLGDKWLGDWLGRSLGRRFVTVSLVVLLIVQLISFAIIDASLRQHTLAAVPEQLTMGTRSLERMLEWRSQRLLESGRLLAADYGFRAAVQSNDRETIASVLANHGARIGASEVELLDTRFASIAHAEGQVWEMNASPAELARIAALAAGHSAAGASEIVVTGGQVRQMVLVPMKAPVLVGWVAMYFRLPETLAEEVHQLAATDVTVLTRAGTSAPWSVSSSGLAPALAAELAARSWQLDRSDAPGFVDLRLGIHRLGVRVIDLARPDAHGETQVIALLTLSLDQALRPPRDLQIALLSTTLFGFVAFGIASAVTARRITTPLQSLAAAAERLGAGDSETPIRSVGSHYEVRDLAQALEQMRASVVSKQQQIVQSEKLASIGQLAAGVAHEINNPIGFVFSNFSILEDYHRRLFRMLTAYRNAELALTDTAIAASLAKVRAEIELDYLENDIPALMSESRDGIQRVRKIVQDLKDFSHVDSRRHWELADLHIGMDSTLNIVANEVKYKADVVKEYGPLPLVQCLPHELNQVFMNLIVNAAHAIGDERGRIVMRTRVVADEAWIEIIDNGSGIAPDDVKRIFDPFFTTKPVGKGTGLGLSLSYGIVKKHDGRIEVESEPGRGTTFRVCVPLRRPTSDSFESSA